MFEKEAEEYVRKIRYDVKNWDGAEPEERFYNEIKFKQAYLAGAELGYNQANEWHFVSKEGFPNKDDIYLIIRSDGLHLGDYCCGGDGDIDCQSWCDYPSEEEIQDDSVIAWKDITPPKEVKENEN